MMRRSLWQITFLDQSTTSSDGTRNGVRLIGIDLFLDLRAYAEKNIETLIRALILSSQTVLISKLFLVKPNIELIGALTLGSTLSFFGLSHQGYMSFPLGETYEVPAFRGGVSAVRNHHGSIQRKFCAQSTGKETNEKDSVQPNIYISITVRSIRSLPFRKTSTSREFLLLSFLRSPTH